MKDCNEYIERLEKRKHVERQKIDQMIIKQRIRDDNTVRISKELQSLSGYKPALLQAFYRENRQAFIEESTTQRRVVEQYHMRKLEDMGAGGYY